MEIVPESSRQPYDMYEVIAEIVDDGEWFDIKPKFAKSLITCFARFGGQPVGIVANQPKQLAGILDNDSADKAARFINLCDAFNIPLVFLQDVPGFMVGSKVEHAGIIRHGAKMLYAVSRATVPKVTVIVRKAYGAGYYVMCGKAYEPDLIVAWPGAEISVMGAEGAVEIIGRSAIEASEDPEATREAMLNAVREQIDPYIAAGNAVIDDIIDPRETRPTIVKALRMARTKHVDEAGQTPRGDAGMTEVLLKHEKEQFTGLLVFDGAIFEAFGFEIGGSFGSFARIPVAMMESANASFDSGMLKTPKLEIVGRDDLNLGHLLLPFDPDPSEQAAVAQLVEEIQKAIEERGGA